MSRILVLLALLTLLAGCGDKKPATDSQPASNPAVPPGTTPKEQPKTATPDVSLDSKQIDEEASTDFKGYREKYKGKVIQLKGVVRDVRPYRGGGGGGEVELEGRAEQYTVRCVTTDKEPWKSVLPGQVATVVGKLDPHLALGAGIVECQVTEVNGPRPTPVTADRLAEVLAAKPDESGAQLDALGAREVKLHFEKVRFLVLTGEVKGVTTNKFGQAVVDLKVSGPKATQVYCRFESEDKAWSAGLKAGQKVEVLGKVRVEPGAAIGLVESVLLGDGP
jgi:hypothetical protein